MQKLFLDFSPSAHYINASVACAQVMGELFPNASTSASTWCYAHPPSVHVREVRVLAMLFYLPSVILTALPSPEEFSTLLHTQVIYASLEGPYYLSLSFVVAACLLMVACIVWIYPKLIH